MLFGEEGKLFSLQQQNEGCKTIQNLVDKKILLLQENYFFSYECKTLVLGFQFPLQTAKMLSKDGSLRHCITCVTFFK